LQLSAVVVTNGILFLFSIYAVWGWVTVSDIRAKCEKEGCDFDSVMASLISSPFELQALAKALTGGTNDLVITNGFPKFGRFAVTFLSYRQLSRQPLPSTNAIARQTETDLSGFMGGLIEPFAFMSDNVVNLIFCLGIAYLMST